MAQVGVGRGAEGAKCGCAGSWEDASPCGGGRAGRGAGEALCLTSVRASAGCTALCVQGLSLGASGALFEGRAGRASQSPGNAIASTPETQPAGRKSDEGAHGARLPPEAPGGCPQPPPTQWPLGGWPQNCLSCNGQGKAHR